MVRWELISCPEKLFVSDTVGNDAHFFLNQDPLLTRVQRVFIFLCDHFRVREEGITTPQTKLPSSSILWAHIRMHIKKSSSSSKKRNPFFSDLKNQHVCCLHLQFKLYKCIQTWPTLRSNWSKLGFQQLRPSLLHDRHVEIAQQRNDARLIRLPAFF